jgi:hypothetical protein
MKSSRTPWVDKLRPELEPKVVDAPRGQGRMLVPTPLLVAAEVRKVRRGSLVTPSRIRAALARKHGADVTCPLTTGIFLNILAGAAEEQIAAGRRPLAPYWRVVEEDGSLSLKRPAGPERQASRLRAEGHRLARTPRKSWRVEGFRKGGAA